MAIANMTDMHGVYSLRTPVIFDVIAPAEYVKFNNCECTIILNITIKLLLSAVNMDKWLKRRKKEEQDNVVDNA
jgi:hypothetical protein